MIISSSCTKEEEWKSSIRKAQNGDKEVKDALVVSNIGLIYMVLKRFPTRGYEKEDLFQIGVIGLIKAIDKFDLSRELSFSTYAVPMILGEIRRFIRDDGMLHVSRQIKDHARKIAAAKEELKKTENCDPTMEQLMSLTGLSMDEIVMAIEATTEVESIYQPIGNQSEDKQMLLLDQLEDTRGNEEEMLDRIALSQILERLDEKDRRLIELRYMEGKTQSESAQILGMNQVAVSRSEKRILLFLRKQIS